MNADTRELLAAVAASPAGVHTLATVVAVAGSSYRRPGARMLVHAAGAVAGSVSGGCLEAEIARRGTWWAAEGPVVRRFAPDDDPDAAAPGCGGTIDVLVENVTDADPHGPLAALRWIAARRAAACLATVVRGAGAIPCGTRLAITAADAWVPPAARALAHCADPAARAVLASGRPGHATVAVGATPIEVFLEPVAPPRELLVVGRHHDVAPVVRIARLAGWEVTVAAAGVAARALGAPDHLADPEPPAVAAWAAAHPRGAIVVMTHSLAHDRAIVAAITAASTPSYLGVLGPRHRTEALLAELDVPDGALPGLRTPVGLDLGGDGPEAIALSIVADVQAAWFGAAGARLCAPGTWRQPARARAS